MAVVVPAPVIPPVAVSRSVPIAVAMVAVEGESLKRMAGHLGSRFKGRRFQGASKVRRSRKLLRHLGRAADGAHQVDGVLVQEGARGAAPRPAVALLGRLRTGGGLLLMRALS